MNNDEFIDLAIDCLKTSKVSNYKIAVATGLSQSAIGTWKRGDKRPTFANAQTIIGYFNGTKDFVVKKEPENEVIMVPVLNLDARGGLLPNANCDVAEYTTSLMPFSSSIARKGDVVVPVYGDSMIPKYAPGTMILIRNIELWSDYLELGSTYVLELIDDRRTIKNIMKGDNNEYFRLESINPKYEPTEIPKKIIRHVFSVLMAVRKETM